MDRWVAVRVFVVASQAFQSTAAAALSAAASSPNKQAPAPTEQQSTLHLCFFFYFASRLCSSSDATGAFLSCSLVLVRLFLPTQRGRQEDRFPGCWLGLRAGSFQFLVCVWVWVWVWVFERVCLFSF
jgi:hypothetical protein